MAPIAISPERDAGAVAAGAEGSFSSLTTSFDDTLRFYLNGTRVVIDDIDPEITLLEYLRGIGLTGTKLGCGEGGCGACTVVVSQYNPTTKKIYHASVNACLAPLVSVDGKHVITVEGIGNVKSPHPVQERIARGHGSQCGFCTPGIVMSLYALLRNNGRPTERDVEEAFDGNLCRCTGYRTILDAANTFTVEAGAKAANTAKTAVGCGRAGGCCRESGGRGCGSDETVGASTESASSSKSESDSTSPESERTSTSETSADSAVSSVSTRFTPPGLIPYDPATELIFPPALRRHEFRPLAFGNKRKRWFRPVTLAQLLEIKRAFPQAKLIGGSSETQIEIKFKALRYPVSVYVGDVADLRQYTFADDHVDVGGAVTLTDLEHLAAAAVRQYGRRRGQVFAAMRKQLQVFAGRQIRNVGTPAGNLVTASPISDLNPVLMAAEAVIQAQTASDNSDNSGNSAPQLIPMADFFVGYRRTALPADAVLAGIRIPLTAEHEYFRAYKQAKRKDDDIAIVTAAMRIRLDADGIVEQCRLVYGGMAPTTVAAQGANAFLVGRRLAELDTLEGAIGALGTDFDLSFSVPGGMASYRRALALSLFYRFYQEVMEEESRRERGGEEEEEEMKGEGERSEEIKSEGERSEEIKSEGERSEEIKSEGERSEEAKGKTNRTSERSEEMKSERSGEIKSERSEDRDDSAFTEIDRDVSFGATDNEAAADYVQEILGKAPAHVAALKQTVGVAQYTDDQPPLANELHGCLVLSQRAHARVLAVDYEPALALAGVVEVIDRRSMPNDAANHWGPPHFDEVFFAEDEVHTVGQPIAMVLATTAARAAEGARAVRVDYEDLPAVFSIEEAIERGSFFDFARTLRRGCDGDGNMEAAFAACDHVITGESRMGGQEHFYLETNAAVAVPKPEDGEMELFASTQNPNETQAFAARVCNVQANKINVRVKRLGGGFGGKETRAIQLSSIVALAAHVTRRPVRCMLTRDEDMVTSGQRHPFLARWKVGVSRDGRLQALSVDLFANGGWTWDLSAAVCERAMTHCDNCYFIPQVAVRGRICRTNTMSNTAFRGFGGPQGLFVAECYMSEVADRLGMPVEELRARNLYAVGQLTPFNQALTTDWHVPLMYGRLRAETGYDERQAAAARFNAAHRWRKRGLALIPTKFGISFTALWLNQAGALVHIYHDGSVLVAHGGTEMGQGLHTKMTMIAAQALGVPLDTVFISETATSTVANASATAASASSDLNGYAVQNACDQLNERLAPYRERLGAGVSLRELAHAAYADRVNLSAQGFYKTPEIGYSWEHNRGKMYFYFTQGVAAAEVEVDTLTGAWTCLRADVLMDVGRSINPAIDYGQIQGAFVQGMGLFTMEESLWLRGGPNGPGHPFTRGPGAYKIPGFRDVPQEFNVQLLRGVEWAELRTIQRSRGVGEPPLFMGSSVFFALRDALKAARAEFGVVATTVGHKTGTDSADNINNDINNDVNNDVNNDDGLLRLESPATAERIRLACVDPIMQRARVVPKPGEKDFFIKI